MQIQECSGKHCPYCRMLNIPDARFCSECKLALTIDAFNETIEEKAKAPKEAEQRANEFEEMKAEMEILKADSSAVLEYFTSGNVKCRRPKKKSHCRS